MLVYRFILSEAGLIIFFYYQKWVVYRLLIGKIKNSKAFVFIRMKTLLYGII
jgi:hypothetical protein